MNIVFKRPDGGIALVTLTPEAIALGVDLIEHAQELKSRGNIPHYYELVATEIPEEEIIKADKENFRDAWTWTTPDKVIDIDHVKAQEITKNRLRADRKPLLEALDVKFMRAIESGEDTISIVAEKQRLRDITQLVDDAKTLDGLKSIKVTA